MKSWWYTLPLFFKLSKGLEISQDILCHIQHCLDLWYWGDFSKLTKDTETMNRRKQPMVQLQGMEEHVWKVFVCMILQRKLQQEIGWMAGCDKGGLMLPKDTDRRMGKLVVDFISSEHPDQRHQLWVHFVPVTQFQPKWTSISLHILSIKSQKNAGCGGTGWYRCYHIARINPEVWYINM